MGIFDFFRTKPVKAATVYHPDNYWCEEYQSIVTGGFYDLERFSVSETSVINQVLTVAKTKYPDKYRSIGLANESYSITQKPRYILHEIIILRYADSPNPIDRLAVAFAYETKGAFFRKQAINYFESSLPKISDSVLEMFSCCDPLSAYSKLATLYEKEHDYEKSILALKKVMICKKADVTGCMEHIKKLEEKIKNPPRTRTSKMPEHQIIFEEKLIIAAQRFSEQWF